MPPRARLLAYIYVVLCGGCLVLGTALCLALWMSWSPGTSNRSAATIIPAFTMFSAFYFIPGLVGGLGLLRGKPWARPLLIVLSVLVVIAFPIGTALGGFGLWVLLGKDSRPPDPPVPDATKPRSPWQLPSIPFEERERITGILIAAASVGSLFVVMIGTGYRVTATPGSPIGDGPYFAAIAVLVLIAVRVVRNASPRDMVQWALGQSTTRGYQERLEAERRRDEEARRNRLAALAADPVRRKYATLIESGEPWSNAQIEYDLDPTTLATCAHLQPIERAMRDAGLAVRFQSGGRVEARCRVDQGSLNDQFALPAFVQYEEPQPQGRSFEDPLPARIRCGHCDSVIDVIHRVDATPDIPVFPATGPTPTTTTAASGDAVDPAVDRFLELRTRIQKMARLIDAPNDLLPAYRTSEQNGGPHIEIDGPMYHYVFAERGNEHDRFSTASINELLYRTFRDIAFSMSSKLARPLQKPGEDFRREMFRQQLELLRLLNPEWAARCAVEHQQVLINHPFVDER